MEPAGGWVDGGGGGGVGVGFDQKNKIKSNNILKQFEDIKSHK